MASASSSVPVGFYFHPTDLDLLRYFLHNRVSMADQFCSSPVFECPDFYGKTEPWVIWDIFTAQISHTMLEGDSLYFFTHRKRLNPKSKHFDRKVGSGTWSGNSKDVVSDGHSVVGMKRFFRYEGGSDSQQNGAWLMQEYEITPHNDLVLCALKKKPRKVPTPTTTCTVTLNYETEDIDKNKKRKMNFGEDEEATQKQSFKRKKIEPPKQKQQLMLPSTSSLSEQRFDESDMCDVDELNRCCCTDDLQESNGTISLAQVVGNDDLQESSSKIPLAQGESKDDSITDCSIHDDTSYQGFHSELEALLFGLTTENQNEDEQLQLQPSSSESPGQQESSDDQMMYGEHDFGIPVDNPLLPLSPLPSWDCDDQFQFPGF